jgi:hypothetical protein
VRFGPPGFAGDETGIGARGGRGVASIGGVQVTGWYEASDR